MKEAFALLDSSGDGYLDSSTIRFIFPAVCPSLTSEKFDELLEAAGMSELPNFTYAQFHVILTRVKATLGLDFSAKEMRDLVLLHQVFEPFDKERTGFVDVNIFTALMMEKGDKLQCHEAATMVTQLRMMGFLKKGCVNYRAFLSHISSNIS